MKIQNNGSPESAPLESARAQPAPQGTKSSGTLGQTISGHDGDSIQISSMSTSLADANAADGQQRANRVAELAALHSRGGYQVNAANLSSTLVSQALTPGGEM